MKVLAINDNVVTVEIDNKKFDGHVMGDEIVFTLDFIKDVEGFEGANICKTCDGRGGYGGHSGYDEDGYPDFDFYCQCENVIK